MIRRKKVFLLKYIIVGSSHFGYEAVETILEAQPEAEIHLYERGDKASFMSCGAQSYLEGIAKSLDEIHYANEDSYKEQGINVHLNSDVVGIDPEAKTITVKTDQGEQEASYDKLLLSPGGYAPKLNVPGKDLEHVYTFRGRDDAEVVKARMTDAKKVIVIGGGYIGVEVAEAYVRNGQDVTLIDAIDRFLPTYLDEEFYSTLIEEAKEKGLEFRGNEFVQEVKGEDGVVTGVVTDQGEYERSEEHTSELQSRGHLVYLHSFPTRRSSDLVRNGQDVTLIDAIDRFLPTYLDEEFYSTLIEEAKEKGLEFRGNEFVQEVKGEDGVVTGVVTDQGEYEADTVIMAVGVRPDTDWLKDTLDLDEKGFVVVNDYLETSAEDVYAGGDATYIRFNPTGKEACIGLATNARKQGVTAAKNALGDNVEAPGVNGTSEIGRASCRERV